MGVTPSPATLLQRHQPPGPSHTTQARKHLGRGLGAGELAELAGGRPVELAVAAVRGGVGLRAERRVGVRGQLRQVHHLRGAHRLAGAGAGLALVVQGGRVAAVPAGEGRRPARGRSASTWVEWKGAGGAAVRPATPNGGAGRLGGAPAAGRRAQIPRLQAGGGPPAPPARAGGCRRRRGAARPSADPLARSDCCRASSRASGRAMDHAASQEGLAAAERVDTDRPGGRIRGLTQPD